MSDSLQPHGLQHTRPPCPFPSPGIHPSSYLLNQWCHPSISFSITLFSFCLQSFPASGSFPMSWLFVSGGQSFGASASASVFPVSIQGWSPLGLTVLISLLSKGLPREGQNGYCQEWKWQKPDQTQQSDLKMFVGICPSLWSLWVVDGSLY